MTRDMCIVSGGYLTPTVRPAVALLVPECTVGHSVVHFLQETILRQHCLMKALYFVQGII